LGVFYWMPWVLPDFWCVLGCVLWGCGLWLWCVVLCQLVFWRYSVLFYLPEVISCSGGVWFSLVGCLLLFLSPVGGPVGCCCGEVRWFPLWSF